MEKYLSQLTNQPENITGKNGGFNANILALPLLPGQDIVTNLLQTVEPGDLITPVAGTTVGTSEVLIYTGALWISAIIIEGTTAGIMRVMNKSTTGGLTEGLPVPYSTGVITDRKSLGVYYSNGLTMISVGTSSTGIVHVIGKRL